MTDLTIEIARQDLFGKVLQKFGRSKADAQPPVVPGRREKEAIPEISGVITDQKLVEHFYKYFGDQDIRAIATDRYMDRSRETYNEAWLSREIVQNFVDHNAAHPGTLDGVNIRSEKVDGTGKTRFTVEGDWPFADVTGVISPHSEKPDDRRTAGGNGIGLKQAAIRLLRDFGVERFEIQGEGWQVNYHLAQAAQINRDWAVQASAKPLHQVKHDWLIAEMLETKPTGKCSYVIETDNSTLIHALEQMPDLGVSESNKYLQEPDFKNKHGAIKWLPLPQEGFIPQGRLFINGQVMNYNDQGKTAEDYWRGPELVTLQLNNVDYQMSVDRPPISRYLLDVYMRDLVNSMTQEELLEQLRRSEPVWSQHYSLISEEEGCFYIIKNLVQRLRWEGYQTAQFGQYFGDKRYLAWDKGVSQEQVRELREKGYVVCPGYFAEIGMVTASSRLGSVEAASNQEPKAASQKMREIATDYGLIVQCQDYSEVKADAFPAMIGAELRRYVADVNPREGRKNTLRIKMKTAIPEALLFHSLPQPKREKPGQELLYKLRGVVKHGLEGNLFSKAFMGQGEYVTTFALDYDFTTSAKVLLARNNKSPNEEGVFVEVEITNDVLYAQLLYSLTRDAAEPITAGEGKPAAAGTTVSTLGETEVKSVDTGQGNIPALTIHQKGIVVGEEGIASGKQDEEWHGPMTKFLKTGQELEGEKIKAKLNRIPVPRPEVQEIAPGKVIIQHTELTPHEKARLQMLEQNIPGIQEAIEKLDALIPQQISARPETTDDAVIKYIAWRESGEFYGQAAGEAGYLTGRHLAEIIEQHNQADITTTEEQRPKTAVESEASRIENALKTLLKRLDIPEHRIDHFNIVLIPEKRLLAQLALLRTYMHITTRVALPNDLFIYEGTGSKGINISRVAIGLHRALLDVEFTEALRTFGHEIAHNAVNGHDVEFIHMDESIAATVIGRLHEIQGKLYRGESLTPDEVAIVDIQNAWNILRGVE